MSLTNFFGDFFPFFKEPEVITLSKLKGITDGGNSEQTVAMIEEREALEGKIDLAKKNLIQNSIVAEEKKNLEEKIDVAKRTLITKLYSLEQELAIAQEYFPEEYKNFLDRIENVRQKYLSTLKELEKLLTFEIDPEYDSTKIREVRILEKDIKNFIETKVKFAIVSKRIQQLILGVNLVYNASIFHYKENEKQKALSQTKLLLQKGIEIAGEIKNCKLMLEDRHIMDRLISLISYIDYEIFKLIVRNADCSPRFIIEKLILFNKFDNFDYIEAFSAFIKDELSELNKMIFMAPSLSHKDLKKKSSKLLNLLTYSDNIQNLILDSNFWNDFMEFETNLFQILKENGVDKDELRVKLIPKMNITADTSDVISSPVADSYMELINIYSKTHDEKIWVLAKFLKTMLNTVTYKEIYFLVLLFDLADVVKDSQSLLTEHLAEYFKKYPYTQKEINRKKELVMNSSNKEYVALFVLKEYEGNIIGTLETLNFDIKAKNDIVYINSFYFKDFKNVVHSLECNSKNI